MAAAVAADSSIVRIRELKKDHVDFVLENVDLAYVPRRPVASLS